MARNKTIDTLRGFFHIVMLLDHLPSAMSFMILNFFGFISPPAGFIFVSGLVAGLVYGKKLALHGQKVLWRQALARVRVIYAYHLFSLLILYFLPMVILHFAEPGMATRSPGISEFMSVWPFDLEMSLLLLYQPGLYALLPVYFIFTLLMPLILVQLSRGRYWQVASVSILLWVIAQVTVEHALVPGLIIRPHMILGPWNLMAWQLLFVAGLIFGIWQYHQPHSALRQRLFSSEAAFLVCWCLFILLFCMHHELFPNQPLWQPTVDALSNKGNYGPLRLLSFISIGYMLAHIYQIRPQWFQWRALAFIGEHSMQVFAFHLFLLTLLDLFLPHVSLTWLELKALTAVCIFSLYIPAWLHQKYQASCDRREESPQLSRPPQAAPSRD